LLHSRAKWLWQRTTTQQREACFYSGLGAKPGLFIHERLDTLTEILATFRLAVGDADTDSASDAAILFARSVMTESFFGLSKLPDAWESVIAEWIKGTAFSEILKGLNATQTQRTQAFVQMELSSGLFGRQKPFGFRRSPLTIPVRVNLATDRLSR